MAKLTINIPIFYNINYSHAKTFRQIISNVMDHINLIHMQIYN